MARRPWSTMVDHGRPWFFIVFVVRHRGENAVFSLTMADHGRRWSTMVDHGRSCKFPALISSSGYQFRLPFPVSKFRFPDPIPSSDVQFEFPLRASSSGFQF